jgi:hypothetical protein
VALVRTVADVLFGVTGQTIYHDCAEGRPSAVTSVSVYRWHASDDGDAETAVGSGSVETNPNTTIDADSGYGQSDARRLNVAATTGAAIDRTYLVTGADGFKEWFDCAEIDSGNYLIARHPLHNPYVAADTVQSTRIQATIDSSWVADETNLTGDESGPNPSYRVRWVYVVGGVTYVADSYFNLVRYAGTHGVRPQDIEVMYPNWLDSLPTDHRATQGRKLIDNAYREVKIDMHQVDVSASSVAESEVVDELVRYKAIELGEWARFLSSGSDEQRAVSASARYQSRLDSLVRIVSRVPIRDSTGAATPIVAVGLTRR